MNKYCYHIDVLKGIGIILVVLGHLNPGIYLEKWIYSFHMFLFFFLSGYIFKKKENIFIQIKASLMSLILPFIFWNGIAIIFSLVVKEYTLTDAVKKMFYLDGVSWNSPVWFLVVLFWTRLYYQLLGKNKYLLFFTMGLMAIISYYSILSILPLGFNILPNAIIFFGLGMLLSKIEISKTQCLLAIPLIIVSIIGSVINNRISMYGNYFGNYILALPVGISGVVGIFLIIKLLSKPTKLFDFLQKIGKLSLIMCTHYFILKLLSKFTKGIFNGYDIWNTDGFIKAIVLTAVIIVVELEIIKLLKRLNVPSSSIMRI